LWYAGLNCFEVPDSNRSIDASTRRFDEYIDALVGELGRVTRAEPFRSYCTALLLPGERKSVEPLAAAVNPSNVRQTHQSLHHFVADSPWNDEAILARVAQLALPALQQRAPISVWIVDDTGLPKKGDYSVGVAHQYCGQLGKQSNCQVAVSLSVANEHASLPIAYRLYLPRSWADDQARRDAAGVPPEIIFETKPEISLGQIRQAIASGLAPGVVVADAAYGNDNAFRDGLRALGLRYAVAIQSSVSIWRPGESPLAPQQRRRKKTGRPITNVAHAPKLKPISVLDLARELPASAFRRITWREGTKKSLHSRFAAVRVRIAHGDRERSTLREKEWLLIEWPRDEESPTKYWLSTLDESTSKTELVRTVMTRWRIERDYQNLKQELGLGQYEGRSWRGFHHHATLCFAAYGFLIIDQEGFSPFDRPRQMQFTQPAVPDDFRPRGSAK
jgi:SRSO17 transposase